MKILIETELDSTYTVTLHLTATEERLSPRPTDADKGCLTQAGGIRRRSHVVQAVTEMLRQYEEAKND